MKSLKSLSVSGCIALYTLFSGAAFGYGNVTPTDAFNMATSDPNVYILDVRTEAEWQWVGHPGANKLGEGAALQGKVINISYEIEKDGALVVNEKFVKHVDKAFREIPNAVLITLCRSGARSAKAAALLETEGYQGRVYNTSSGFEGAADTRGYRVIGGWKIDNLPYSYEGLGYKGDK